MKYFPDIPLPTSYFLCSKVRKVSVVMTGPLNGIFRFAASPLFASESKFVLIKSLLRYAVGFPSFMVVSIRFYLDPVVRLANLAFDCFFCPFTL
jgi:hypothetical protein